jgi:outer membrane protein TolC
VAALGEYELVLDESAVAALRSWVELNRYYSLNALINSRLDVLGPMITQLEQVAEAGLGDAAMVSAAQRTVSMIQVTQTDVEQRLAQAEVGFLNVFGNLPASTQFDENLLSSAVPVNISRDLIVESPALRVQYAKYQAALAGLRSVKANDSINLGFQSKIQRPFGESEYDSDESLGLVLTKTLYNGGKLGSEIELAEAEVNAQLELFKSNFRAGERTLKTAQETISAMEKAVVLAESNATNIRDEITYLRRQLIIGQSTLDSVLSAEARLYDAEAKEIDFIAERHLAELTILAVTGRLSSVLDIDNNP